MKKKRGTTMSLKCVCQVAKGVKRALAETKDAAWKEVERQYRQDLKKVGSILKKV